MTEKITDAEGAAKKGGIRAGFSPVRLVLFFGLLAALVWWLSSFDSFRETQVWSALSAQAAKVAVIALVAALAQIFISTVKWQFILRRMSGGPKGVGPEGAVPFNSLFSYTAASHALSQVLPAYVAGPAVRGWIMKARHAGDFGKNALASGYEQLFDIAVLLACGVYALVVLLGTNAEPIALGGMAAFMLALGLLPRVLPHQPMSGKMVQWLPTKWRATRWLKERLIAGSDAGLDAPEVVSRLIWLSIVRYAVLALRTVLLGLVLMPAVTYETIAFGFSAVQLSSLLAITPGNLGITEIGWSGVSAFTNSAVIGDFAAFAIALRVSGLIANWLLFALLCLPQLLGRKAN